MAETKAEIKDEGNKSGVDGDTLSGWADIIGSGADAIGAIGGLFGRGNARQPSDPTFIDRERQRQQEEKEQKKKQNKQFLYIGLGVLAFIVIVLVFKKK